MHFLVLVIVPDGAHLQAAAEKLLAPFGEGYEVAPYDAECRRQQRCLARNGGH